MRSFTAFTAGDSARMVTSFREQTHAMQSVQEAAQRITELLYQEFHESLTLVRFYLTVPYQHLPVLNRHFVASLAEDKQVTPLLRPATPVLSLLGTAGVKPDWNHYQRSKGHLGIPLVGAEFVESIPMISQLMGDLGVGLHWFDTRAEGVSSEVSMGAISGLFYVEDASTTLDSKARRVIPAKDFVDTYSVRTVFGVGGTYLSPEDLLAVICFTRESLTRAQVQPYQSLLTGIKAATARCLLRKQIFKA